MKKLLAVLLILLIVLAAYGQTLKMYFVTDDFAAVFKAANVAGPAGTFGSGIYDKHSSYRGVAALLYPIYLVNGVEPQGYYIAGLAFYFLASLSIYLLAKALTDNKKTAFAASAIFAAGYIGAESVVRVATSIHTSHMIIAQSLALSAFVLSFKAKSKKFLWYVISLSLFIYTIETGFIRAHGIILIVIAIELLLNFRWLKSLIRLAPFVGVYARWYSNDNASNWIAPIRDVIFTQGKYHILSSPLMSLENIFIPDILKIPLVVFLLVLALILLKRNRLLWLSVVFCLAPLAVPFFTNNAEILGSTHRYITTSLVGFSIFMAVLLEDLFANSWKFYFFVTAVIVSHLILVNVEEAKIVSTRSVPALSFYKSLKTDIPNLPKGSSIYFDVYNDPQDTNLFSGITAVGSMPVMTSIALQYGIDRYDLYLPGNFGELISNIKTGKTAEENIYTFFYSGKRGLVNTTEETRKELFGKSVSYKINDINNINLSLRQSCCMYILIIIKARGAVCQIVA